MTSENQQIFHSSEHHHAFYGDQQHIQMQENFHQDSEAPTASSGPVKREKRKYRCRKRSPATIERAKTVRRDKANARERRRMNSLNDALEHLRTILPSMPDEPKMTKIETLRKAQEYIASLSYQLSGSSPPSSNSSHPSPSFCESACSCCPSLQSTPFQSPCFPPPNHFGYSNPNNFYQSPHFPGSQK